MALYPPVAAATDTVAGEPASEEPPPAAESGEAALEETMPEEAHVGEPVTSEPPTAESGAEAMIERESAVAPGEEVAAAEPAAEETPAEAPAPPVQTTAEAAASEPEAAKAPEPKPVESVVAAAPPPLPPKPAAPAPAKPGAKAPPAVKHEFKDPKKRASAQSVLRACRAGEDLDLDSAATLVRAMDGIVNLRKSDAQFGDVRVEVKFRGQNIMFSSGEFVDWARRKILPEAKASV